VTGLVSPEPRTGVERFSVTRTIRETDLGANQGIAGWAGVFVPGILVLAFPGAQIRSMSLRIFGAARLNDQLTLTFTAPRPAPIGTPLPIEYDAVDQRGQIRLSGTVEVEVGAESGGAIGTASWELAAPDAVDHDHRVYEELLKRCEDEPALSTAVVFPTDRDSLAAVASGAQQGIIDPILVGPATAMRKAAEAAAIDLEGFRVVDAVDEGSAARRAVELARDGTVAMLMKGNLHTAALLRAVLDRSCGLRGARRISHVFLFDVPAYPKPLLVSDAVVNIAPRLAEKVDICRNAIDVAHAIEIREPKVAILSAVEVVDPAIPSTLDAAALCKMADRGQITGGVLDGPLAMDNAISALAASSKHIGSSVSGQADLLIMPNLEAGNILYKNLTYLADADAAGVVVGARVPIILASRADPVSVRIASAALASILFRARA
jgi:phosphotransacetylase